MMRQNLVLGLILIFWSCLSLFSQERERGIVFMQSGAKFKGNILWEDSEELSMQLASGDTILLPKREIVIVKANDRFLIDKKWRYTYKKGIFYHGSFGSIGNVEDGGSTHMQLLYGYRFNEHLSLAASLGFEFHSLNLAGFRVDTQFSSFSLYSRYYFNPYTVRLFVDSRLGYGVPPGGEVLETEYEGGPQAQIGAGLHFASKRQRSFILHFSWHWQKTAGQEFFLDNFGNEVKTEFDIWFARPMIRLGIEFH